MKKKMNMKPIQIFWMLLTVMATLFGACQKEDTRDGEVVAFRELELTAENCHLQDIKGQKFILIFNNEQLSNEINCKEASTVIDFDKEFVIAGQINLPSYPSKLTSQKIEVISGKLKYILNIDRGAATQPSSVYFMAAVPKKYKDMQVELVTKF